MPRRYQTELMIDHEKPEGWFKVSHLTDNQVRRVEAAVHNALNTPDVTIPHDASITVEVDAPITVEMRNVLQGVLDEWDRLTKYGSPMAKSANSRINAVRELLKRL